MSYELVYTQRAARDIEKLDPIVKRRLGNTLLRYKENPFRYTENSLIPNWGLTDFESEIIGSFLIWMKWIL